MARTPEGAVKQTVKRILDALGVYHFSPFQAGMGRAGIPDIICCCDGQFLAIECKAGKGKLTLLQEREINKIRENGGTALVINEENINQLKEAITWLSKK